MSLSTGEIVGGRYRIDAVLGGGGFGAVYRATQLNLNRPVALKVLHAGLVVTEGALERFRHEAELAQQLKSPNTVRVYDFGTTDRGLPFIVWEFLEGRPLDAVVAAEGSMPPARVAHVTRQILKALMEAHATGIVHRDIKPANVVLTDFPGERDFVKVLDFGIAKDTRADSTPMTIGAAPLGTPAYMSPEQVRNEPVGPAADLYALGLTVAELLSGRVVVHGRSLAEVLWAHSSAEPLALPPEVLSGPLGSVVQRATQKSVELRYRTAADMLMDLERVAGLSGPSVPASAMAATLNAQGSQPPLTPLSPVYPPPIQTANGVQVTTLSPPSERAGGNVALALFAGFVVLGLFVVVAAGGAVFFMRASPSGAAAGPTPVSAPAAPAGGESTELGARSGKGFDGIGPTTISKRIAPAGWKLASDPIKNIEGTFTSSALEISRGTDKGTITLYRFDDEDEAKKYLAVLRQKRGSAVELQSAAIMEVLIPQNEPEALKLLGAIKGR
ncbi:MAG: serine/threonine protein kinase [Myxococcales bacterium]|nr:serine/threonine protein kinase [Myxococcales bacterium]